jgi:hypothetical protein
LGFVIFFLTVLIVLGGGGFALWRGYVASRENYIKQRRWRRKKVPRWKRQALRPRKSALGLSRQPARVEKTLRPERRDY